MVYSRYIEGKHVVNTGYFQDILKIYIYIFMARLEYFRYITGILQVYYRYIKWYIRGALDGILKVY